MPELRSMLLIANYFNWEIISNANFFVMFLKILFNHVQKQSSLFLLGRYLIFDAGLRSSPAQKVMTIVVLITPSSLIPVPTVRQTPIPLFSVTPGPLGLPKTANPPLQLLARMTIPVKLPAEKSRHKLVMLTEQLPRARMSSR